MDTEREPCAWRVAGDGTATSRRLETGKMEGTWTELKDRRQQQKWTNQMSLNTADDEVIVTIPKHTEDGENPEKRRGRRRGLGFPLMLLFMLDRQLC